jgi:phage/plasmid-like protein (TIGR03299 family)
MVAAGLDWDVEARPVYDYQFEIDEIRISENEIIQGGKFGTDLLKMEEVPGARTVRRVTDGKYLGNVGSVWTPLQNREAFGWFDPLVQEGLATYHTAGSLQEGEIVWILAQIGNEVPIVGDDNIGQFMLMNFGHNGLRGVNLLPTRIRVVCANTLSAAETSGKEATARFTHAGDITGRMDEFRDVLRLFLHDFEQTEQLFKLMAGTEVAGQGVDSYLDQVFPVQVDDDGKPKKLSGHARKLRENILAKFEGDLMGYDLIPAENKKSLWTIYNAVTEYTDHERGRDDCRLRNAWFGEGAKIKVRALAAAETMI